MARTVEDPVLVAVLGQGIGAVLWADAEIQALEVNYDAVVLSLRESTGREVALRCVGHIGVLVEGFWDEMVIASADLVAAHPFMDRCFASLKERLGDDLPPTGSPARNSLEFSTLVVHLGDGAQLLCTASEFEAVELSSG
jgi:hypothetical protein